MRNDDPARVLALIEKAVLSIQGRYCPGRPMYYAMGRLHEEVRRAQREASATSHAPETSAPA